MTFLFISKMNLILASASQTVLSSESLNEESQTKKSISPSQQFANKLRSLTKSSDVTKISSILVFMISIWFSFLFLAIINRYAITTTSQTS